MSEQPAKDQTIRCPECGNMLGRWVLGRVVSTHQGRSWVGTPEGIACEQKGCSGVWGPAAEREVEQELEGNARSVGPTEAKAEQFPTSIVKP